MGVGKTAVIRNYMEQLPSDKYSKIETTFSARTAAKNLQNLLETKLEKKRSNLLGAATGKNVSWLFSLTQSMTFLIHMSICVSIYLYLYLGVGVH